MGIKRRAMFSRKFKAGRPELYKKGQEIRNNEQIEDNSVMIEKLKEENLTKEQEITDTNFTEEVVEEMIKEVEEMVKEVEKPKPKPKATRKRAPRKPKATTQKKTTRKPRTKKV